MGDWVGLGALMFFVFWGDYGGGLGGIWGGVCAWDGSFVLFLANLHIFKNHNTCVRNEAFTPAPRGRVIKFLAFRCAYDFN